MQVRFTCPACNGTHIVDIPETTVHLTCATAGKVLKLRVTAGGDVKAELASEDGAVSDTNEQG